ncbi:FAD-binding protein [Legionella sp. MW5194]|uniref:FAD-binding oxidoreductase n=1 Tax=Legionella sp. MW5194 TaxID=2662448 RepID=UPI00193DAD5B|nr:FAD-binding oxidoreductase [Legionella sp. MW5194]QRN05082.1 FAD-binding protein [Legionella sp. MW5194]
MRSQTKTLTHFSGAILSQSTCFRPDNEWQLPPLFESSLTNVLARGHGLSYSDCCFNTQGNVIDCTRLNHLLSFDESNGLLYCQGGVTFADLFEVHPDFIPPVVPGTVHASLAGGIANDVHGKNNVSAGSLGQHIQWIELQQGSRLLRVSPEKYAELFTATLAGLGLTGIIRRVALTLKRAPRCVEVHTEKLTSFDKLLTAMKETSRQCDYLVAWLDLLNSPHALMSAAVHYHGTTPPPRRAFTLPKLPFRLIYRYSMQYVNHYYFKRADTGMRRLDLIEFNNPLDKIRHWNRLYGRQGLVQFQAVFAEDQAETTLAQLLRVIAKTQATPTLAVLKYFTRPGAGLLSFVRPGFTLAVDFIHDTNARAAIEAMNQFITDIGGRVYLAKDLFLTRDQFMVQYPEHKPFKALLQHYPTGMQSDLGRRLGITHD